MPSLIPSATSQAFKMPSMTVFLSASDSASRVTGRPCAFFGAISFSVAATHRSPIPEKLVRIAGAPATTPSKYAG
jgi:hypothetical protein